MHLQSITLTNDTAPPVGVRQQQISDGWLTVVELGEWSSKINVQLETDTAEAGIVELFAIATRIIEGAGQLSTVPFDGRSDVEPAAVIAADRRAELAGEL